jgi:hypothetical protein
MPVSFTIIRKWQISGQSKEKCRYSFKWGKVSDHISPVQLKRAIKYHYDNCIEFGAHPNEKASYINLIVTGNQMWSCLQRGDPKVIKRVLCCVERSTISVFEVFRNIFSGTFEKNIAIRFQNLQALLGRITPDAIAGLKDNP